MKEDGNRLTDKSRLVLRCRFPPRIHLRKARSVALLKREESESRRETESNDSFVSTLESLLSTRASQMSWCLTRRKGVDPSQSVTRETCFEGSERSWAYSIGGSRERG